MVTSFSLEGKEGSRKERERRVLKSCAGRLSWNSEVAEHVLSWVKSKPGLDSAPCWLSASIFPFSVRKKQTGAELSAGCAALPPPLSRLGRAAVEPKHPLAVGRAERARAVGDRRAPHSPSIWQFRRKSGFNFQGCNLPPAAQVVFRGCRMKRGLGWVPAAGAERAPGPWCG